MAEFAIEPCEGNDLPEGTTLDAIAEAVPRSGYPLQTTVAALLRLGGWWVQEEWGYVDADDRRHRALDVCAERPLYSLEEHQGRLYLV